MPVIFTRPGESQGGGGLASQVLNDSSVPGLSVKDALEWLESNMASAVYFKMNQPLTLISGALYSLPDIPVDDTVEIYVNGLLIEPGVGKDYTISGSIITFNVTLEVDDILLASYIVE